MGLSSASIGNSGARGLFAAGALAPSGRSRASTRFGNGQLASFGQQSTLGASRPFDVVRNL